MSTSPRDGNRVTVKNGPAESAVATQALDLPMLLGRRAFAPVDRRNTASPRRLKPSRRVLPARTAR